MRAIKVISKMLIKDIRISRTQIQSASYVSDKKPYKAPHLSRFGAVSDLTAAGSANGTENRNQPNHIKP